MESPLINRRTAADGDADGLSAAKLPRPDRVRDVQGLFSDLNDLRGSDGDEPHGVRQSRAVSALKILKPPRESPRGLDRGVVMCESGLLDRLTQEFGAALRERWYFVVYHMYYGFCRTKNADLQIIGDPAALAEYRASEFSGTPALCLSNAEFRDGDIFKPLAVPKIFDLVYVASWAPWKRHELLLDIMGEARRHGHELSAVITGSYCYPGHIKTLEEAVAVETNFQRLAERSGLDVTIIKNADISRVNADGSSNLGAYSKAQINRIINSARAGVLLSRAEGCNRFVNECLLADLPVVLLREFRGGSTKLICDQTGALAEDTAQSLCDGILSVLSARERYAPRTWALAHAEKRSSERQLGEALAETARTRGDFVFSPHGLQYGGDMFSYDIDEFKRSLRACGGGGSAA